MTKTADLSLQGKRVVITGSSMGIGQAVAIRLAQEGAHVVINGRGEAALQDTLASIHSRGGEVVASCGSVADFDYAGELIQTCVRSYGGIDALINCAGIAEPHGSNILDIDPAAWRQLIDVHLHGTFNTCRHAAPIMAQQQRGSIINTSSHAFLGMYGGTGYASGKGATNSLSWAMAMDLKEHGVNVNVVCPGAKTRLSTGDDYEQLIKRLNQRGLLDDSLMEASLNPAGPDYVASLYAFLVSDAARTISGRVFWGSGGYMGLFHRNADELLAMRDHQTFPPWSLEELVQKLQAPGLHQPEALFNVVLKSRNSRLLVRQQLLVQLANSRLVKWLQSLQRKPAGSDK